ncbi:MAG: GIY-YIG nuclease family protein [Limosilactobacillus gorillae]|jgi:putative endonuclease|uniref:GIY-YIG nuclease family protein n=1 Tax=Limosilactobacillus gorillae TaxID=1450649 RepID=UPI000A815B24|nr:GIY-YIG nuclease family protein [Limosilactobacillus gorillae]MDO4855300.1 GIY-YIG nuclease family protein [Limosilactobacillus gorillae]
MSKNYYLYVLLCADQTLYCGFTNDVKKRLATHQAGKGAKYTRVKKRHPLTLLYQECFDDKRSALKAEYAFKHLSRQQKEAYLIAHGVSPIKLAGRC